MATTRVILSYPWNGGTKGLTKTSAEEELGISEKVLKIARKELREDACAREQCLMQLRDWIKKNPDVKNLRMDDKFLLRFLRTKKFSIPMAEQTLLKYLNFRRTFAHMTNKLDFLSPAVNELISGGYIFASPIRDKNGRRVVIAFAKNFDPSRHCSADMARAHFITYETLLEDPENQILGFTHIGDMSGVSAAHITCWNVTEFARIMKWGEQSVPMRHKEIHVVNVHTTVKYVVDFSKSLVSKKINDRLSIHVNVENLIKKVDKECLPLEMGGSMPMAEMIDLWKAELAAKRETILTLDEMELLSDRGIISSRDKNNNSNSSTQMDSIAGSFRKLEVD
uniref:Putative phosphatidylinositol transfer protein sec14 n=1 Tax=Nyssomyia neivai TaxID=330878 RepID=A0A1L8DZ54_9DIPT